MQRLPQQRPHQVHQVRRELQAHLAPKLRQQGPRALPEPLENPERQEHQLRVQRLLLRVERLLQRPRLKQSFHSGPGGVDPAGALSY